MNELANQPTNQPLYSFRAVVTIAEHGYGEDIVEYITSLGYKNIISYLGKGTASTQLLSLLGLGESARDVIICIVPSSKSGELIKKVYDKFEVTGVAFSTKLNSIGGRKTLNLLQGDIENATTGK